MKFLLTCPAGLESFAKREITSFGGEVSEVYDRLVFFEGEKECMIHANLTSRVGNKVYIVLGSEQNVEDFDSFFESVYASDFSAWYHPDAPLLLKATSVRSTLTHTPSMQSLGKKALIKQLRGENAILYEDENLSPQEILLFLYENTLFVLLDTSGEPLHKRGYRVESGEAPIKENLAAGLVLLSHRRYREPLYDIMCGSGTIAIEAALLAKNIAPGMLRSFAFEDWGIFSHETIQNIKQSYSDKVFSGSYQIIASDRDPEVIEMAKINAKRAGVDDIITFEVKSIDEYLQTPLAGILVSNPPYGVRLEDRDLKHIYFDIERILIENKNLGGGIITSYEGFPTAKNAKAFKNRKLYNGGEKTYFYMKK